MNRSILDICVMGWRLSLFPDDDNTVSQNESCCRDQLIDYLGCFWKFVHWWILYYYCFAEASQPQLHWVLPFIIPKQPFFKTYRFGKNWNFYKTSIQIQVLTDLHFIFAPLLFQLQLSTIVDFAQVIIADYNFSKAIL